MNIVHSSDNSCEACCNFQSIFPESQLMTRLMYPNPNRNDNKILARVTTIQEDKSKNIFLDFKDENESDNTLKISRESGKIDVTGKMNFVNAVL